MSLKKATLFLGSYLLIFNVTFGQMTIGKAQLEFDHLVIFAQSNQVEDSLTKSFFNLAEKASSIHYEQGTEGHYIFFYNTYIEFLYMKDSTKIVENESRFGSNYSNRWKTTQDFCPIGFGLNLTPFDTTLTEFKFKVYNSSDSPQNEFYLMSEYNTYQDQPLIYLSMPQHDYLPYESLNEVDQRFEEYMRAEQRSYLTHPSEVKRLTKVILTVPESTDSKGNIDILKGLSQVKIRYGDEYSLILVFDNQAKGKEIIVPNDFQLIIKY